MLNSPRRKFALAAAVVAAGALILAGCAPSGGAAPEPSDTPVFGGSITVGGLATKALDPGQVGFSSQSAPWTRPILGTLFLPPTEAGGDYRPNVAEGYEYNADGTQLTIHLRKGGLFSDGTPLDGDAVAWNLNRHRQPGMREGQFFAFVTDVEAVDATTVVVTFSQEYGLLMDAFAYSASGYMASPTAFDSMGADAFNAAPVGAGPFKIQTAEPGQELDLVKNDNYWDAAHVYLDAVTFVKNGDEEQAAIVGLQSGSLDSVNMNGTRTSPAALTTAEGDASLQVQHTPNTTIGILPINTFAAPFDDLKARQAVAYCMDREVLAKSVAQGFATPAFVLSGDDSTALSGWEEGKDLNPYQHDVDKGTALVKELGGLSFTVVTNADSTVLRALQQQWAECGIDAQINITDDFLSLVQKGTYQMASTTNANSSPNPALSTNYLDPASANNKFGWRDADITALVEKAKGTIDNADAAKLWKQIWTDLSKQGYLIPVLSAPYYVLSSACLKGVDTSQGQGTYTNAYLSC